MKDLNRIMMKVNFRNILIVSALLIAVVSCNKEQRPGDDLVGKPIAIKATEAGVTKAMLDKRTFASNGNRLQIYDFVDNAQIPYINDRI